MSDGPVTLLISDMFTDLKQRSGEYIHQTEEYMQQGDEYIQQTDEYVRHSNEYVNTSRLSSPTCEDLGIPREECVPVQRYIRNPSLHIDGLKYETGSQKDPFSPLSLIPLPSAIGVSIIEPTFVRKRNERERYRVRCVNDGFSRLKEHLPLPNKDKRISKAETLRTAIRYIKHLQTLLQQSDGEISDFSDHSDFSDEGASKRALSDVSGCDSDDSGHEFKRMRVKSESQTDSSSDDDIFDAT